MPTNVKTSSKSFRLASSTSEVMRFPRINTLSPDTSVTSETETLQGGTSTAVRLAVQLELGLTGRSHKSRNDGCARCFLQLRDFTHENHSYRDSTVFCSFPYFVSCLLKHDYKLTIRTCAIIGGVLTIAGLVDSFIFNGAKKLKGEQDSGFGGPGGKMV